MNSKISLLAIAAVFLFASCHQNAGPKPESVEYASTDCLIEAETLLGSYQNYVLIDIRKPEEFQSGHIPNALNVWRNQITDTSYAYGGMMPGKSQVESLLSNLGIQQTDTIVIYDDKAECDAARLWWILKFYGHKHIKLLNGGLTAWRAADGELSADSSLNESTEYHFTVSPDSTILSLISDVELALLDSEVIVLDTRGDSEHSGSEHKIGAARAGNIEGSKNLDWAMAVDYNATKKFLPAHDLKIMYASIGIDGREPVITYCHTGVRSAHTLFVLTELLGYRNIRNYDGSWTEWSHLRTK
ncbi:MAG: sulfurtransferase [Flavobacteriales bacterium]|nr:sulfurtransferase [Flavobacteriales bacterium]